MSKHKLALLVSFSQEENVECERQSLWIFIIVVAGLLVGATKVAGSDLVRHAQHLYPQIQLQEI